MAFLKTVVMSMGKYFSILLLILSACEAQMPAYRICKPGPAASKYASPTLKKCLIIGDSVSIGYAPYVRKMLSDICYVQHAPWDTSDGGALDTKYALECMKFFLSTANGSQPQYDAIIFNSGLHDVEYCPGKYHEEYVPYKEYVSNIEVIANRLNLTGANVGFVSSTPIPFDVTLNNRVKSYNNGAKTTLEKVGNVQFFDLYEKVVDICGEPVFNSCFIMNTQPDVHYKPDGYQYLGVFVSQYFISLLKQNKPKKHFTTTRFRKILTNRIEEEQVEDWVTCKKPDNFLTKQELRQHIPKQCFPAKQLTNQTHFLTIETTIENQYSNATTACPSTMTCCAHAFSDTGLGCCVIPDAVTCKDHLHCCPSGMMCSSGCGPSGKCYCTSKVKKRKMKKQHKLKL